MADSFGLIKIAQLLLDHGAEKEHKDLVCIGLRVRTVLYAAFE